MRPELLVLMTFASLSLANVIVNLTPDQQVSPNYPRKVSMISKDVDSNITLRLITTETSSNSSSAFQPALLKKFLKMLLPSSAYVSNLTMEFGNGNIYQASVEETKQSKYRSSDSLSIHDNIMTLLAKTMNDTDGDITVMFKYHQPRDNKTDLIDDRIIQRDYVMVKVFATLGFAFSLVANLCRCRNIIIFTIMCVIVMILLYLGNINNDFPLKN